MEVNVNTYFNEDAKEYCYAAMIRKLIKRLKEDTGINLRKLDQEQANEILRNLVDDFADMVHDDMWLELAWDEV